MAWTRAGQSGLRQTPAGWLRGSFAARRRWKEFAPLAGEVVTADDASHVGLPSSWYEHFVQDHFKSTQVRAEQLKFAIDDPSIRDLLRYKIEQRQLVEELASVLDEVVHPYDAIAAGVADAGLAVVVREVFDGRDDVTVRELIPEVQRRAVRDFLVGTDGRPSPQRVRRAAARSRVREEQLAPFASILDRRVGLTYAIQSGAAGPELHDLARTWFGEAESLSVEELLLASQVPEFARVLGWQKMMANL